MCTHHAIPLSAFRITLVNVQATEIFKETPRCITLRSIIEKGTNTWIVFNTFIFKFHVFTFLFSKKEKETGETCKLPK